MQKKYIILILPIISMFIFGFYKYSDKALRKYTEYQKRAETFNNLQLLNKHCLKSISEQSILHTQKLNLLRHCVHNNSIHMIDNEFYKTAHKGQSEFVKQILQYSQSKLDERPHFECSRRSMILNDLYKLNGYESRMLNIFSFKYDKIWGHVLVEVINPDHEQFTMQDPTYDTYYKHKETKNPISFKQAVQEGEESFIPCNYNDKCSWDMKPPDGRISTKHVKTYWSLGYIGYNDSNINQLLYNSNHIDIHQQLKSENPIRSFCDVYKNHCKNKTDLAEQ